MSFPPLRSKSKTEEAWKLIENYLKMVWRSRGFEGSVRLNAVDRFKESVLDSRAILPYKSSITKEYICIKI